MKIKFIQGLMIGLAFALWTGEVLAHASGRGFVLLLPTETMQFAGTTAVALSFALIAFTPAKVLHVLFREWHLFKFPLLNIETALSLLGLLFWTTLVVAGYIGARDPLGDVWQPLGRNKSVERVRAVNRIGRAAVTPA